MKPLRSFASDNNAAIHPEILKAIAMVNQGHVVGYGADPYTALVVNTFREHSDQTWKSSWSSTAPERIA